MQLLEYISSYILNHRQHGFHPNFSTATAIMFLNVQNYSNTECGKYSGAIFLDLKNAFETVDHSLLLGKLSSAGLSTSVISWFKYRSSCFSSLLSPSSKLSSGSTHYGVPHGSGLFPFLFSLFPGDLPWNLPHINSFFMLMTSFSGDIYLSHLYTLHYNQILPLSGTGHTLVSS